VSVVGTVKTVVTNNPLPVIVTNPPGQSTNAFITNPATNPVPTSSVDDPGRTPYQSFLFQSCTGDVCLFGFPAVPASHRLVIQHVSSGELVFNGTPTGVSIALAGHADSESGFLAPFAGPLSSFDQSVLYYLDSGEKPRVAAGPFGTTFAANGGQSMMLSGYLIDCTVSPCAPIAH
jgi:hypothetical protein